MKLRNYLSKFGTVEGLMAAFSPDRGAQFAQFPERCIMGDCPTLSEMARMYSQKKAASWLEIQLRDAGEFSGAREKLRIPQLMESAKVILSSFYFLKLSEVMLFFFQLKGGRYGKFYGSVDPMMICEAMRSFIQYRGGVIEKAEQEQAHESRERGREGCCSRQAYDQMREVEIPIRILRDSDALRHDLRPYDVGVNGRATIRIPKRLLERVLWYEKEKQISIVRS